MEMDRPSIAFAHFLDSIEVVQSEELWLTCKECGDGLCLVEDGDTLRVLLNTALAHDCP